MKIKIFLITALILGLIGCKQSIAKTQESLPTVSLSSTDIQSDMGFLWKKYQDSIRTEILKHKENKTLKESFLQEFYIRGIAQISNDSVLVTIPFNLHGPDCGAPDCYSTDISFRIKLGDSLIFPDKLPFTEYEYGCVETEKELTGVFQLIEQTDQYVIYHSKKDNRTLALFRTSENRGSFACYFTEEQKLIEISGENINKILEILDESAYPYKSTFLNSNEYDRIYDQIK